MNLFERARSMSVTVLIMFLNGAICAGQAAWPQFRGPGGLGIAPDERTYPTELDTSGNVLWRTETPEGYSSPCIWGNSIFITARSGKTLETICIDREDGKIRWRRAVEPNTTEKINSMNSYASPTPACDGKRVYVYFGSFGLLAYDFEGKELWKKPLPVPQITHGSAASPILVNDLVVISCDQTEGSYLLAVNRETGDTVWRRDRPDTEQCSYCTPVFWKHGELEEIVVLGSKQVISYDPKDGQERWRVRRLAMWTGASPVYAGETLFATTVATAHGDPVNPVELPDFQELLERCDRDGDKRLTESEIPEDLALIYRIGPDLMGVKKLFSNLDSDKDGALSEAEWKQVTTNVAQMKPEQMDSLVAIRSGAKGDANDSFIKWRANEGIGQVASPLVYRQRLYLVKEGGIVTCFNAETGQRVYSAKLGPRAYYNASPVAGGGKIYFCSQTGTVIVVQAGDEFKILASSKIGERINATAALLDGNVYLRTEGHLFAFGNK
jgi:outer membrane protein assembly factor BamB